MVVIWVLLRNLQYKAMPWLGLIFLGFLKVFSGFSFQGAIEWSKEFDGFQVLNFIS